MIEICKAKILDRPQIAALVIKNHLALSEDDPVEYLQQLSTVQDDYAHLLDDNKFIFGIYFIALFNDDVVACAGITPMFENEWKLTAVSVKPEYRKQGLGEKLVKLAIEQAIVLELKTLKLITLKERMEPVWRLYEKLGFKRIGEKVYSERSRIMTILTYNLDL